MMKIAFVTDDGISVSRHFGRAGKYLVVEVNEGREINRELREKMGHQHFAHQEDGYSHGSGEHGFDPASQSRHANMLSAIEDCDVVVCGGMGRGAYHSITDSGKQVFMVEDLDINGNLANYFSGTLKNAEDLVH